jgi:hypothetical protein
MTQKTIQCRLVASPETRQYLWNLAARQNTPLINKLIEEVVNHPDFEEWRKRGRHSTKVVDSTCSSLKTQPEFSGQPSRFYMSAAKMVNYIFKSWFKIQSRLQQRLSGKQKWLEIIKSDQELIEQCGKDLEAIQKKADQILRQLNQAIGQEGQHKKEGVKRKNQIRAELFKKYNGSKQGLAQYAIAYLLKNGCRIPNKPEDPEKFGQRRRRTELQIQQLQDQIDSRIPKGRDLTGQAWLETLLTATTTAPKDNQEHKQWQDCLLAKPKMAPYPILWETNEDLVWSLDDKGRLCVHFNGLSEHLFKVYCDQRQLPWFKRFLKDQQTRRASKRKHSTALFALRSARISWKESGRKGEPWDTHYLILSCAIDERLWSTEGTEEVRQEKAADIAKILTRLNEKDNLSETQQGYAQRLNSTLEKLDTPFNRPSTPRYKGQENIIAGVSLGWDKPITLAIWNTTTQQVLAYRSLKQLLGKDYPLFLKHRQEQQRQAHNRHKAQRQGKDNQFGTSNLGQHIDRLLAKAVVAIAQQYSAGSIAIPTQDDIREILQAEIDVRAEQKIPGYLEGQKRYTRQYKRNIHKWSFGRLIDQITSKAAQTGLTIETVKQPMYGSYQDKAKGVAISAYESRMEKMVVLAN